ncbi:CPBP family intramembrane metalloprotease [Salmonella enterica subsp. enterica]|nr:CPBP family intramembrane metalloprotease [Salmonella enterica subsp. enterica]
MAVLFGLLGIFVLLISLAFLSLAFIWEVWLRLLYIVLFLSMRLPHRYLFKYYPFYHWATYHLWNIFFSGAIARCAATVLYNAFIGPEPGWPSYQRQFFFINFLTYAGDVLSETPVAEEIIFRGFIKQQYRLGSVLKSTGSIITSLAFAIMHKYLFAVTFVLSVCFSSILCVVPNEKP